LRPPVASPPLPLPAATSPAQVVPSLPGPSDQTSAPPAAIRTLRQIDISATASIRSDAARADSPARTSMPFHALLWLPAVCFAELRPPPGTPRLPAPTD